MPDSYLWNKKGEPDREIERLEKVLGTLKHEGGPPRLERPVKRYLLAAAAVLALTLASIVTVHHSTWSIDPSGVVRLNDRELESSSGLSELSVVETGPDSRATLKIGLIGTATLGPETRVTVESTALRESRLGLEHGTIFARIGAPPRLFYVSTASAEAIDLGCAYELSIDSASGTGLLRVTLGWVALDAKSGRVFVPRGMSVRILGQGDLSVPVRDDADESFRSAVEDSARTLPRVETRHLEVIDRTARSADSLTIWHLIRRADPEARRRLGGILTSHNEGVRFDIDAVANGNEHEIEKIGRGLGARESRWWAAWTRQAVERLTGGRS